MSVVPVRHQPAEGIADGLELDHVAIMRSLNLNPSDPKTQALLLVCQRYNLDPLLKHVVLISGNAYVTRDGYLAIAHRSGQFDGMEVLDVGESTTHHTAKVAVYRKDMSRPFAYVGRYPKSGQMAKSYGPEMAVKVAEVQALRRAFNVTGISAADEMWDDGAATRPPVADDIDPETGEVRTTATRPPVARLAAAPSPTPDEPNDPFRPFDDSDATLAGVEWAQRFRTAMAGAGFEDPKVHGAVIHYGTGGRTRSTRAVLRSDIETIRATFAALIAGRLAESVDDGGAVTLVEVPAEVGA